MKKILQNAQTDEKKTEKIHECIPMNEEKLCNSDVDEN